MKKEVRLLDHGLFEKSFMDSKARTRAVSAKEIVFGHLIGPLGLILIVNTIAALVEKFFTQQTGAMYGTANVDMIRIMGSRYEVVMTVAKVLAVGMGILNGWLVQHTHSKQGRLRPWYLIFGFCSIIIGALIFQFAGPNDLGETYWYYFFFLLICYHTVGSSYFFVFKDTIVSLTSRNPSEKMRLKFVRQLCWTLISGILIGMMVSMVVLPMWLENDISGYPLLMIILSVIAIPLLLLEYFYTRERITEDVTQEYGDENKIPLKEQMKALFTNKYYVLLTIIVTVGSIVDNFKGGNVQYFYIKFLLGGADNPIMFTLYQVATGIPLGIGAFAIYPLAKKFGIKNVSIVGYICVLIGSVVGLLNPSNIPVAIAAGFLRQTGMLPNAYVFATLVCYAYDSVEHDSGYRLEGLLGPAIVLAVQTILTAPFAGGYESGILKLGFVDVQGITPNSDVLQFMTFAFYMFDIVASIIYIVLLPFVDIEKKLLQINEDLRERQKQIALSKGEEWIEPEEIARREREETDRIQEQNRIHDLEERCAKKGLDFGTENRKYLEKQSRKKKRLGKR